MNAFWNSFGELLGLGVESKELTFLQVSLRGVIVFAATLVMMRLSSKRSLAEKTAFDAVLIVIIASVLARAINGSAAFFPTLGAGFVLVVLHRLFSALAFRSERFGNLVKGREDILVKNGKLNPEAMRVNKISQKDLLEEFRLNGQVLYLQDAQL